MNPLDEKVLRIESWNTSCSPSFFETELSFGWKHAHANPKNELGELGTKPKGFEAQLRHSKIPKNMNIEVLRWLK